MDLLSFDKLAMTTGKAADRDRWSSFLDILRPGERFWAFYELGEPQSLFVPSEDEHERVCRSHESLLGILQNEETIIYGTHTHFGGDVEARADSDHWESHQSHLVSFLRVGRGPSLPERVVRRALRLQARKLARGLSGISPITFQRLVELGNSPQLPAVPCWGSLGASGDLIPMAHAVAPIILNKDAIGPRDALALVNTNAMMCALAIELGIRCYELLAEAVDITGLVSLALAASPDPFSAPTLLLASGRTELAAMGEAICYAREKFLRSVDSDPIVDDSRPLQERYSLRCAPQLLTAAVSVLRAAESLIITETLAVADNPLIIQSATAQDLDGPLKASVWHGGLFYSASLAAAVDMMVNAMAKITEMIERQTFLLVDPDLSGGLPRNLAIEPGDHIKGIHQLINALNQTVRSHSLPSNFLAAPAESYNQDIVPATMSTLNSLSSLLEAATEMMLGARFIAERGAMMRLAGSIPARLELSAWADFGR